MYYKYWFLICLITFPVVILKAQDYGQYVRDFYELKEYYDNSYIADYNLWNGRRYLRPYSNSIGHPFFNSENFREGSLRINGTLYEDVLINYDITNQQVILQQTGHSNSTDQIILTRESIDEFSLDGRLFRQMSFPETGTGFFQIVSSGEISCYFTWRKEATITSTQKRSYSFTPQIRKAYLVVSGQLNSFRSLSSFINIIGEQYKKEIRQYRRQHKFYLRSASDKEMKQLIDYCISLTDDK